MIAACSSHAACMLHQGPLTNLSRHGAARPEAAALASRLAAAGLPPGPKAAASAEARPGEGTGEAGAKVLGMAAEQRAGARAGLPCGTAAAAAAAWRGWSYLDSADWMRCRMASRSRSSMRLRCSTALAKRPTWSSSSSSALLPGSWSLSAASSAAACRKPLGAAVCSVRPRRVAYGQQIQGRVAGMETGTPHHGYRHVHMHTIRLPHTTAF
jgi:hypothetical protein